MLDQPEQLALFPGMSNQDMTAQEVRDQARFNRECSGECVRADLIHYLGEENGST